MKIILENLFLNKRFPFGDITCQKTISEHSCGVTSLAYNNGLIYSGAHDGSTKVLLYQMYIFNII